MMRLEDGMKELTSKLKLPLESPDEDGVYRLIFDNSLEVEIFKGEAAQIIVSSPLLKELPEDEAARQELLAKYLRLNFAALKKEQEDVLSLDPDTNHLVLYRKINTQHLYPDEFVKIVESHLNNLELWRALGDDRQPNNPPTTMISP